MLRARIWLHVVLIAVIAFMVAAPAALAAPPPPKSTGYGYYAPPGHVSYGPPSYGKYGGWGYCSYKIRWGDTLANIAWRYHTTTRYLMNTNWIRNPNRIYAGTWLRVPCMNRW
jgi:hypothetical protein